MLCVATLSSVQVPATMPPVPQAPQDKCSVDDAGRQQKDAVTDRVEAMVMKLVQEKVTAKLLAAISIE